MAAVWGCCLEAAQGAAPAKGVQAWRFVAAVGQCLRAVACWAAVTCLHRRSAATHGQAKLMVAKPPAESTGQAALELLVCCTEGQVQVQA